MSFICIDQANILYLGDNIGSEGAQALAESLKQNTTLTQLNLSCMSELNEFLFAVRVRGLGSKDRGKRCSAWGVGLRGRGVRRVFGGEVEWSEATFQLQDMDAKAQGSR